MVDLFGAPGSFITGIAQGAGSILKGHIGEGVERLAPRVLSSKVRAARELVQGVTRSGGRPVYWGKERLTPTWIDTVIRMGGFNPANLSEKTEKQWNEKETAARMSERRSSIYEEYRRAWLAGDRDALAQVFERVETYNAHVRRMTRRDIPLITKESIKAAYRRYGTAPKTERLRAGESPARSGDGWGRGSTGDRWGRNTGRRW
jgi:hypothetical protein